MLLPKLFGETRYLLHGFSYWKALLTSGRWVSELEMVDDLLRGRRPVDWTLDIVGSGDAARIKELYLCTPAGETGISVSQPYTAFQFKRGTLDMFSGTRIVQAQAIGRVNNRESGMCTASVWDAQMQQCYDLITSVRNFEAWREGIAPPGALAVEAMGVRLEGE